MAEPSSGSDNGSDSGSDNGSQNGSNGTNTPNMPYWGMGNPYSTGFGYNMFPPGYTGSSSLGSGDQAAINDAKTGYEDGALHRYQEKTEFDQEHSWLQQGIQAAMYAGGALVVGGLLGALVGSMTKNGAINTRIAELEKRGYERRGNIFEKERADGTKVTKKMPKAKGHVTKMAGIAGLLAAGGGALFGVMNAH
jgi:hypothetical protein